MTKEIWKEVLGNQKYLVSNKGRVYSKVNEYFLIPSKDQYGYLYVRIKFGDKIRSVKVHRLVAEAFLGRKLKSSEDIHHLISKDDNNFDHMIVLPHSQHLKIHKFGTHHSQETKDKISIKMKKYWQNKRKQEVQ